MADKPIYSKTARGFREVMNKTKDVSRELRSVLELVDGKSDFQMLLKTLDGYSEQALQQALSELIVKGYLHDPAENHVPPVQPDMVPGLAALASASDNDNEFDFTAMADSPKSTVASVTESAEIQHQVLVNRNAEEDRALQLVAQGEMEAQLKRETEVRADRVAEEVAKRRAEQEQARKKNEALIRQEVEAIAQRRVEEDRLRREAEAQAAAEVAELRRREIWAQSRLEAKILAKRNAQAEKSTQDVESRAGKTEETKIEQEHDALVRREIEERRLNMGVVAQKKAQAKIRREADANNRASARAEQEAQALADKKVHAAAALSSDRQHSRRHGGKSTSGLSGTLALIRQVLAGQSRENKKTRRQLVRAVMFALFVWVIVFHVISFDERLSMLEKTATAQFGQPVKAQSLHFRLLPTPHWHLQNVVVGDQSQIHVALVKMKTSLGALFSSHYVMPSIDAVSAIVNAEGVKWLLEGKARGNHLGFSRISIKNVHVSAPFGELPDFDVNATLNENGNWQQIEIHTPGQQFNVELKAAFDGMRVTLNTAAYRPPLSLLGETTASENLTLKNFSVKGVLVNKAFDMSEFSGEIYGGYISGKARLDWHSGWLLDGEIRAKLLDTAAMFPALLENGLLSGEGIFAAQATNPASLMSSVRTEGKFLVERGMLRGMDLGQALHGLGHGGRTPFATLNGNFVFGHGKTQLSDLRLTEDILTAIGRVDVEADKTLRGRFSVELKSKSLHERGSVSLTGSLDRPQFGQ